jgi:very-short-patch-repair endonuclease/predicted transcriptional regulator of viral defense system
MHRMDAQVAQIPTDVRVAELATAQHGVVSRGQLRAAGLGRGAIEKRIRSGRLHPLYRGVYSVGHAVLSRHGHWMAAVLACGDGAALSHRDAGAIWGIRPSASPVTDVTVPTRSGRVPRRRLRIHRAPLPRKDVTVRDSIPVTTLGRTLVDLAAVLSFAAVKKAIEEAERLRLFDLKEVELTLQRNAGRAGTSGLARALREYEEPAFTRSDLEDVMVALCKRHGLAKPIVNGTVAGYEVDFLWRDQRLIVETDGREDHLTRHAFEDDRARDAKLMLLGYRVVRFTYRQLRYEREYVVTVLTGLLQPEPSINSTR